LAESEGKVPTNRQNAVSENEISFNLTDDEVRLSQMIMDKKIISQTYSTKTKKTSLLARTTEDEELMKKSSERILVIEGHEREDLEEDLDEGGDLDDEDVKFLKELEDENR